MSAAEPLSLFGDPLPPPPRKVVVREHLRTVTGHTEPLARSNDPATSREAARRAKSSAGPVEDALLRAYAQCGAMTTDQAVALVQPLFPMHAPESIKGARSRLTKDGWLVECGRGLSDHHRPMTIYRLTEAGRERALREEQQMTDVTVTAFDGSRIETEAAG